MSDKRRKLYEQQKGLCFWCARKMADPDSPATNDPLYPTVDHMVSKAAGGRGGENLKAACYECNTLRGVFNTGAWQKDVSDLKKTIHHQSVTIQKLKTLVIEKEKENKRLIDNLQKIVEDYKPWWKKLGWLWPTEEEVMETLGI